MTDPQPIGTAPRDGTRVLICDMAARKPEWFSAIYNRNRDSFGRSSRSSAWLVIDHPTIVVDFSSPTHWLPQPPLPYIPAKPHFWLGAAA